MCESKAKYDDSHGQYMSYCKNRSDTKLLHPVKETKLPPRLRKKESPIFHTCNFFFLKSHKRGNKQGATQSVTAENWSAARPGEWFPETTYFSLLERKKESASAQMVSEKKTEVLQAAEQTFILLYEYVCVCACEHVRKWLMASLRVRVLNKSRISACGEHSQSTSKLYGYWSLKKNTAVQFCSQTNEQPRMTKRFWLLRMVPVYAPYSPHRLKLFNVALGKNWFGLGPADGRLLSCR